MNPINLASNNGGYAVDEFPKNKIDEFSNKQLKHSTTTTGHITMGHNESNTKYLTNEESTLTRCDLLIRHTAYVVH